MNVGLIYVKVCAFGSDLHTETFSPFPCPIHVQAVTSVYLALVSSDPTRMTHDLPYAHHNQSSTTTDYQDFSLLLVHVPTNSVHLSPTSPSPQMILSSNCSQYSVR